MSTVFTSRDILAMQFIIAIIASLSAIALAQDPRPCTRTNRRGACSGDPYPVQWFVCFPLSLHRPNLLDGARKMLRIEELNDSWL